MDILGSRIVSTRQSQIAELAKQSPTMSFTSLNRHLDLIWMREAYRKTRKDGAKGIDDQSAEDFAKDLEENLKLLLERAKSGVYFAPPVRRAYIPKGGSSNDLRPIGIPTFADKVLQRAIVMLLERIFENDFLECSYGFRPGRSQHEAISKLRSAIMEVKGGWVVNIDMAKFFDTLDKAHLRELLKHRINDGVIKRLIGKWLNAGVFENNQVHYPEYGSPQGGVVSPLVSNVYLHYVLDLWFEREVRPRLSRQAFMVRFADDVRIIFVDRRDAERFFEVLPKRFAKYGLQVNSSKTKLVEFNRPSLYESANTRQPETFDFLGFTYYWAKSRKGKWVVKLKTANDRFWRGLKEIKSWCRENRHRSKQDQHRELGAKLRGHFGYYGVSNNSRALSAFKYKVLVIWRKWLSRRSQKGLTWQQFLDYLNCYPLPVCRIYHPAI